MTNPVPPPGNSQPPQQQQPEVWPNGRAIGVGSRTVMGVPVGQYLANKDDYDRMWARNPPAPPRPDNGSGVSLDAFCYGTGPLYHRSAEAAFNSLENHAYSPWRKT